MSMDMWPRYSKRVARARKARERASKLERIIGVIEYYRMVRRVKKH